MNRIPTLLRVIALDALVVAVSAVPVQAQTSPAASRPATAAAPVAAERWDDTAHRICRVCRRPTAAAVHSVEHRGQVVPLCDPCRPKYDADPERWFRDLQPRAALFSDEYDRRRPVSWFAFGLGAYVLAGLVCAAVAGAVAVRRGHAAWSYVLLGVVATVAAPLLALRLARRQPAVPSDGLKQRLTYEPAPCSHCAAPNHPSAAACGACGQPLQATVESEVARTGER